MCPQDDTLDTELTVFDNLFIYGRYFGIPAAEVRERAQELLEFVQLTDKAKAKVEELSGGMKRRLTIARSLINRPDLLLLDEPTTGLDPQARHLLWDKLFRLKQTGVTLVITTHYMDEAEQLCDRLVVMDKGVIVAEGSPAALIAQHSTREVTELRFGLADEDDDHAALAEKVADLGERVEVLPDRLLVYSDDGDEVAAKVSERGLRPGRGAGPPLHAGGRLPPPDRPDAGGLMSGADVPDRRDSGGSAGRRGDRPPGRLLADRLPPHLEGHGDLVVRGAAVLRRRDGRAAGRLHRGRPGRARGRDVLPRLPRARAARGPRHADRGVRDDVPGDVA